MENLGRVLENYGLKKDSGIVMEGDANHYTQLGPNAFLPEISTESAYASSLSADAYVLVQNAQAIREIEFYRDSLEIQPILSTTESGYIKQVENGRISLTQEEGDETGSFRVGVSVTEEVENGETQLVYFSSSTLVNDDYDELVMNGNTELLTNVITELCGIDAGQAISIPAKSLSVNYLSYTQQSAVFWRTVVMILIPGAFLAAGFVIWIRRRKQ